jgi:hypothetical protein
MKSKEQEISEHLFEITNEMCIGNVMALVEMLRVFHCAPIKDRAEILRLFESSVFEKAQRIYEDSVESKEMSNGKG